MFAATLSSLFGYGGIRHLFAHAPPASPSSWPLTGLVTALSLFSFITGVGGILGIHSASNAGVKNVPPSLVSACFACSPEWDVNRQLVRLGNRCHEQLVCTFGVPVFLCRERVFCRADKFVSDPVDAWDVSSGACRSNTRATCFICVKPG